MLALRTKRDNFASPAKAGALLPIGSKERLNYSRKLFFVSRARGNRVSPFGKLDLGRHRHDPPPFLPLLSEVEIEIETQNAALIDKN